MSQVAATIGHNNPPSIEEEIHLKLEQEYDLLLLEYQRLLARAAEMPAEVNNDAEDGKVSDYLKKLSQLSKDLDTRRKSEKQVWDVKSDAVQSFFKKRMDVIKDLAKQVSEPLEKYKLAKADAERRAKEEKARLAQEEADRKLREAQEAQRRAEEARQKAEEEAAAARAKAEEDRVAAEQAAAEAKRKAESDAAAIRAKAEAEAAAARAEADRIRQESANKEEEGRRAQQAAERAAKEKEAEAARIAKDAERAAKQREEDAAKDAREKEREAAKVLREADERAAQLQRDSKAATREANKSLDEAVRADKVADKLDRQAGASLADLSRTRGDHSVSSVSTSWKGAITDRDKLDATAMMRLLPHLTLDALDQAANSFARATKGQIILAGVTIFEDTKSQVR